MDIFRGTAVYISRRIFEYACRTLKAAQHVTKTDVAMALLHVSGSIVLTSLRRAHTLPASGQDLRKS
jgi:hypothetical protein